MFARSACLGWTLAALTPALLAQSGLDVNSRLDLLGSETMNVRIDGSVDTVILATLDLEGQPALLELLPHSVRGDGFELLAELADGALVALDPGPSRTLRGQVIGQPGSRVAASLLDDGLYARIKLADGAEYWLQPLVRIDPSADPEAHVLYRTEDIRDLPQSCGADLLPNNGQKDVFGGDPPEGAGPMIAELACDADFEYFQDYGSSTTNVGNRIAAIVNAINLQYESEVGISHALGTILVRTSSNQPYTSTDAVTLLNQFRTQWLNNHGNIQRDLAQLFTGKEVNGGTIGIAWVGVVCNTSYAFGAVQSDFNGNFGCATDLSAHEAGHNWNAGHCNCTSNTMNPYITCANTFHPTFTIPDIVNYRNAVGCLDDGGGPGGPGVIFGDGFESGSFSAGGWAIQNNKARVLSSAANTGAFGARLRSTTWIEKSVSTAGLTDVTLSYSRRTSGLDSSEFLFVEYWDGAWKPVEQTSSTSWGDVSFDLAASADNNAGFKIRFRTNANRNNERGDVDNVELTGV